MIKTLRITTVIAAFLAAGFLVFPAIFGVRSDHQAEKFLKAPSAIEKFNKAKGQNSKTSQEQVPPLVKQAEAFALYLNPPKSAPREMIPARERITPKRPTTVSAKFDLIGTSFYQLHPDQSLALINQPGKGLRWVRQLGQVGHLVIEQIKDGLVVVRDGQRTFELEVERPKKTSLIKVSPFDEGGTDTPDTQLGTDLAVHQGPQTASRKAETQKRALEEPARKLETPPPMSEEEIAAYNKLIEELKALQTSAKSDGTDAQDDDQETAAAVEKLFSEFKAMHKGAPNATKGAWEPRVSAKEAEKLDRLGEQLKDIQLEPNQAQDDMAEAESDLSEPNFSEPNLNEPNLGEPNDTRQQ